MRWVVALVAVAVALGLRAALDPWLGARVPYITVYAAIIVAAWFGGVGPAFLAAAAAFLGVDFFFIEPRGALQIANPSWAELGAFLVSAALIAGLGGAMHAARRRAESSEERFRTLAGTVAIDVTEQARALEALRLQREELRAVADTIPAGVVRTSADFRYVWVNRLFASWAGRAPGDIVGRPIVDIIGERGWRELRPHLERVLAGERVEYERLAQFAGLGERWIRAVAEPTRDERGVPDGLVAVISDVHERRNAEAALRAAREQLQLVADSMPAAVALCGRDLRFIWVNHRLAEWLGTKPEDLVGRALAEVLGRETLEAIGPSIERVLAGEHVQYERLAAYPGLGERWVRTLFSPTRDGSGWISVMSDIHERKLMEQTLREAERRKDEFLATLAHELRNPLAPIRNAVAILSRKSALDPELAWSRDVIDRQAGQLSRLIDDLLDIARIASGKLLVRKERVALERAIDMALETSRPHINAAGHHLSVLLPSERVTIDADPARLAQVFSNLLNNAARYTDGGGEITLAAEVDGSEAVVSVQDNGIGFTPEVAGRLFEPFAQLTSPTERSHGGLGIGLSLVQGIVALHGGKVEARSAGPGKGSEFIVRLPLPAQPGPVDERRLGAGRPKAAPASGVKVLVADDNRDAADSLERILSLYGYKVHVAYDGKAALDAESAFQPRVAVLDIGMPGANGFEVARAIRQRRNGSVTLIALTGWGQEGDRRRAMDAGFDYHLTKPVDPEALNDLLVEVSSR